MDLESQAFVDAKESLRAVGLLDPQRLAVTPESSLPDIASLAVQGKEATLSKKDMLAWLTAERYKAIPQHQMLHVEKTKYDSLHSYRFSLEETNAMASPTDLQACLTERSTERSAVWRPSDPVTERSTVWLTEGSAV